MVPTASTLTKLSGNRNQELFDILHCYFAWISDVCRCRSLSLSDRDAITHPPVLLLVGTKQASPRRGDVPMSKTPHPHPPPPQPPPTTAAVGPSSSPHPPLTTAPTTSGCKNPPQRLGTQYPLKIMNYTRKPGVKKLSCKGGLHSHNFGSPIAQSVDG